MHDIVLVAWRRTGVNDPDSAPGSRPWRLKPPPTWAVGQRRARRPREEYGCAPRRVVAVATPDSRVRHRCHRCHRRRGRRGRRPLRRGVRPDPPSRHRRPTSATHVPTLRHPDPHPPPPTSPTHRHRRTYPPSPWPRPLSPCCGASRSPDRTSSAPPGCAAVTGPRPIRFSCDAGHATGGGRLPRAFHGSVDCLDGPVEARGELPPPAHRHSSRTPRAATARPIVRITGPTA
jgi:hypothetical protein